MKTIEIKISSDLDFVYLKVDGKVNSRWPITDKVRTKREKENGAIPMKLLNEAKITAFDLLWHYAECNQNAKIIPYYN